MNNAQSGIFALGTGSHSYLEFDLKPNVAPLTMVHLIASLREPSITTGGVNMVVGFRPELWAAVAPTQMPSTIAGFNQPVQGVGGYLMPATQHDLWLWVAGHAYERVFDAAREAISTLKAATVLVDETDGWTYRDNRDLTGFIDGTENPSLSDAPEIVLIPEGVPGAAGSICLVQKWVHDTAAWEALSIDAQEKAIGRTKPDSVELPEEIRGPQSHVSRTVIKENGEEHDIFRRNTPFGTPSNHGTMFVGFSAEQRILATMLARMAGVGDGIRDALTYYATAITGAYYFIPSIQSLRAFISDEDNT